MLRLWIFLYAFLIIVNASAQDVTISGKANQPGLLIRLIITEDLVSDAQQLVAHARTDFRGRLELKVSLERPSLVTLAAGPDKAEILLVPGCTYNLLLDDKPDFELHSYYDQGGNRTARAQHQHPHQTNQNEPIPRTIPQVNLFRGFRAAPPSS